MKLILTASTVMAMASMATIYQSFNQDSKQILAFVSHLLISVSLLSVFVSMIYNWKSKVVAPITFNQMVKNDLDEFFAAVNVESKYKGIEWGTIDGHYWLEIKISTKDQIKEAGAEGDKGRNKSQFKTKLVKFLEKHEIKIENSILKDIEGGSLPDTARGGLLSSGSKVGPEPGD